MILLRNECSFKIFCFVAMVYGFLYISDPNSVLAQSFLPPSNVEPAEDIGGTNNLTTSPNFTSVTLHYIKRIYFPWFLNSQSKKQQNCNTFFIILFFGKYTQDIFLRDFVFISILCIENNDFHNFQRVFPLQFSEEKIL